MKLFRTFLLLIITSLTLMSCQELFEPVNDNHSTFDRVYADAGYAEGLLMTAYIKLPTNSLTFNDVATDDAVTNVKTNTYLRAANGQWSSIFNPFNQWENCNSAILYLNSFLTVIDTVKWKWTDNQLNALFKRRLTGEAYGLRGVFKYHLLQTIGGVGSNNQLLGIPDYDNIINGTGDFNVPRLSFAESVKRIYDDFNKALTYLTMDDYKDITTGTLPPGLESYPYGKYNEVFGLKASQRISGRAIKAIKARVALLAASPAFSAGDQLLWENAANYAAVVINLNGGIAGIDPVGHRFFDATRVDAIKLASNIDSKEMIWRRAIISPTNTREAANFPPSLYGRGEVNPTQNIVDAFPAANGYPITNPLSLYNPASPYSGRDPRLGFYIVVDGSKIGTTTIKTGLGGGNNAKDSIMTSTRTGYYLRKLLREDVSANPSTPLTKNHYEVHMRYTELYLIYAEAANEAWGPDGAGQNGYSARQVIRAIRNRAGIPLPDNYLASITSKEGMRDLIRNERRLELCFEGFRFWDLRRWKTDLTVPAKGVQIKGLVFNYLNIESRVFNNDFMYYGPLPEKEVIKYSSLVQNKGW